MKRLLAPALIVGLSAALLVQLPLAIAARSNAIEFFDPLIDIRSILDRGFVHQLDEQRLQEMQQAAIRGMIDALDDPYTVYVPPADRDAFNKDLRGVYVGIGAEVNMVDEYLTIVTPMADSPALEAGIRAGDVVLEIEGRSTRGRSIQECIDMLVGEPGTDVTVTVRHEDGKVEQLTITRRRIVTRTVKGLRRIGEKWSYCVNGDLGIAYIRVTQFNEQTAQELREALDSLSPENRRGLVLDLRDNPGGGLRTAISVADLFLDEGEIVSVRGREGQRESFGATAEDTLPDYSPDAPMVVLINGSSASASEVVAGALQDHGRAKVLGTRSFGKGSVQEVRGLDLNRGTLKYTTAHYHLPSGRNIHRQTDSTVWGVDPDPGLVVPADDEAYIEMLRARRDYEVIRDADPDAQPCVDSAWVREHIRDEQLALALDAIAARLAGEDWPRFTEDSPTLTAFETELERAIERRGRLLQELRELDSRIHEHMAIADRAGAVDLLPDDADLSQGLIEIRDRTGDVIGAYRIVSGDIELALAAVDVEPLTTTDEEHDQATAADDDASQDASTDERISD